MMGDSQLRCAVRYVLQCSKDTLADLFPSFLSQRSIMGTAFGSAGKAWTYRYNQRVPGTSSVQHAAENWMMFKGVTTGCVVYFLLCAATHMIISS